MNTRVPHVRIVVAFCVAALIGYAFFSVYVVMFTSDAALKGDVVGTWKSFAVAVFSFWVGSSSAGKAKDEAPTPVTVTNRPSEPVPTMDAPDAAAVIDQIREER